MALAPEQAGLGLRRRFTTVGTHPYDEVEWSLRDARIVDHRTGAVAFEQRGVEFPSSWSVNASNIVAQKYFRGQPGSPQREWSLRQVIDRVVTTIAAWGGRDGYFADDAEAATFSDELTHLLLHQRAAFNSPVWFNIGVPGAPAQASACFILSVEDSMASILNWYAEEGMIFKGGSGAGVNLSRIRSAREQLSGGGTPSGPVSFMRGADASAGTIKSGGTTRRAAKMVVLDVDHPDIGDFIWCKAREERKAHVLRDNGFDVDLDGADAISLQYQNANNSVRVTDEFMQAVLDDAPWDLRAVTTGDVLETRPAKEIFREIAQAAWECADPGLQFDTTINRWHTAATTGRINASNPCFTGDSLVHTDRGLVCFRELVERLNDGEQFNVYTHEATSADSPDQVAVLSSPEAVMITGWNDIVRLRFANGMEVRCTPGHRIFTTNRGWVEAGQLTPDDRVKTLDVPAPAVAADWSFPVPNDAGAYRMKGDHAAPLDLPEAWSEDFAHYLGWVIGDGSTSGTVVSTIYGSAEDRDEVMPRHADLLAGINGGRAPKPSEQSNGTVQLRMGRRQFKAFIETLGVRPVKGPAKTVPWAIEQAPPEVVAAFLRGLFDADGCAVLNPAKGSYVGLGSTSPELLRGVQRLLTTFGITSRVYRTKTASPDGYVHTRPDGATVRYAQRASWDLRITSHSLVRFGAEIGFSLARKAAIVSEIVATTNPYRTDLTTTLAERSDDGVEVTYNLSEPRNHSYVVNGLVVRNCSEYLHLDDSACNLASINLLPFLDEDGAFDVEGFSAAVEVVFAAQEILVGNADYPTEAIGENARRFRQLGLGYTNLGAMLMALGLPYDSEQGRAWAAAVTSLMTGHAYATSARTAARMGPFAGYAENSEHMLRVLDMHRRAAANIDEEAVPAGLLGAAQESWDLACDLAAEAGVRNSQATVLAPTGTISFMLDCDTTGVEPDLGLVKTKKLVGGGTMSIVNRTVPRALRRLGYSADEVASIVAHVESTHSSLGAPGLDPAHQAVFACSMGDNTIQYMGHVRMLAAVQPFISGGISKTANLPQDATVEQVEQLHLDAWRLGLKAIAIYRDNCKVGQPLSATKAAADIAGHAAEATTIVERVVERVVDHPVRRKMPRSRSSRTFEFRVADCKGFATVGEYEDGRPGELFIRVSKQGSTLAGIMDAFAISVSHGLQYGVPLRAFVEAFTGMRFEPAGMTDDPEVRIASSLMDYLFRKLALLYLPYDERAEMGVFSTDERRQPTLPGVIEGITTTSAGLDMAPDPPSHHDDLATDRLAAAVPAQAALPLDVPSAPTEVVDLRPAVGGALDEPGPSDAPFCMQCGTHMQRAGSCFACATCGSTSGCS